MTIDKIKRWKITVWYYRETAKISALSSGKIEYLTGEEILPPSQKRVIEQVELTLGKTFEKQIKKTKTIEDQEEKQIQALKTMGNNYLNLVVKRSL